MLRWQHRWGKSLETWTRAIREGKRPPPGFDDCPDVRPDLLDVWNAFRELGSERQIGMGIGPIPVSKVETYVRDTMGLGGDEAEMAERIIEEVDAGYLGIVNESPDQKKSVRTSDAKGVRGLFSRLKNKPKAE